MAVELLFKKLEPWDLLHTHEIRSTHSGAVGATATFVGTMRDFNEGAAVERMFLEHYPGMTEKHLAGIEALARQRWKLCDVLIAHRIGDITPGEAIVLVAVWSAHRAAAFEACRFIMEDLKSRAPFWKKETTAHGERWVTRNTPGYSE